MKNKFQILYLLCTLISLISLMFLFVLDSSAQTLELNSKQSLTIPATGFFPFSSISNDQFKKNVANDPNIDVTFSNFLGGPCGLSPAADFGEIGPRIIITGNGTFTINFSMAGPTNQLFGFTFVPQSGACIFDLFINPPKAPSTSNSSSSSSSSSGQTATSNSELIQSALDLENNAKNKDLLLNSNSFSAQLAIDKIEKSLINLNELSKNISSNMSALTKRIEKSIDCAISKDNKAKEILSGLNIQEPSSSIISKAKSSLQSAIKCKKDIQKTIKKLKG